MDRAGQGTRRLTRIEGLWFFSGMKMKTRNKRLLWFTGGAVILFFLFCLLVLISVRLSDQRVVVDRVKTGVSRAVGGAFSFSGLDVLLLPYPTVIFKGCRLDLPDRTTVEIGALSIRPRLVSLLQGRFEPAAIVARYPRVDLAQTGGAEPVSPAAEGPSPEPETWGRPGSICPRRACRRLP